MKKLISIFVIVAVLATFLVPSAFASEEPQIVVESKEALPGEEVVLSVALKNCPGITDGNITVDYDTTGLELVEIDVTPAYAAGFAMALQNINNASMNFMAVADVAGDFTMFNVKFQVKDNAQGDYKVGLIINKMVNNAMEDVVCEIVEGVVSTPVPDPAQIVVESKTALAGEEVVLSVALKNCPGITDGNITIDYDTIGLELVEIDVTPAYAAGFAMALQNINNASMNFMAVADIAGDFTLFNVKFQVKDDADGEYVVGLIINKMVNNAMEDVVCEIVEGVVTVNHECVLEDVAEVPATCTEDGVKAHQKCACGKLYIDGTEVTEADLVIPAPGHTPDEPVKENEVPATCTTAGSYELVVYCTECGEELSREVVEVPADHTPDEPVKENEVPATCTEDGSYELVVYCSECGKELSRETIVVPAGHNFVDGECTDCGEKDPDYVPETGDFIYVAVATALVSMMGIVALTKKKEF